MNRFNKMVLMGLLSVATVATNVKGAATPLEVTQIGDKDSKFFVIANPKLGYAVSDQEFIDAVVNVSLENPKDVTTIIDVSAELNISKTLENVTNKDVVCAKTRTQYAQLNIQERAKIATFYACWMIKAYGVNCFEAIKTAKANLNLSDKQGLTEAQTNLIELYFIEQNKDLLKSIGKAQPGLFSRNAGRIAVISIASIAAAVCVGKMFYDANCATTTNNGPLCIAAEGANAVYNKVYGWLAAGIPAIYGSTAAGCTKLAVLGTAGAGKVAENLKKWLPGNADPKNTIAETKLATTSTAIVHPTPAPQPTYSLEDEFHAFVSKQQAPEIEMPKIPATLEIPATPQHEVVAQKNPGVINQHVSWNPFKPLAALTKNIYGNAKSLPFSTLKNTIAETKLATTSNAIVHPTPAPQPTYSLEDESHALVSKQQAPEIEMPKIPATLEIPATPQHEVVEQPAPDMPKTFSLYPFSLYPTPPSQKNHPKANNAIPARSSSGKHCCKKKVSVTL